MTFRSIAAIALFGGMVLAAPAAFAQMNNQPFAFGSVVGGSTGTGSSGMSAAARQAILNEKLTGATPDNIRIGPSGELLTIERGPGRTAITRETDGTIVPRFRGTFTARRTDFALLSLFSPSRRGIGSALLSRPHTGRALNSWITIVNGGGGVSNLSYTGAAIDDWTRQVFGS